MDNVAPPPGAADLQALQQAIAAIESQRERLGDAVTEGALAPLRQRLSGIEQATPLRRAQVTVLFADIAGSTALASRLDAEDTLALFGGVLERAAACVRARDGRVLRFTGDGLKAAFGTEGAHEDDAAQAVQAGLDILAQACLGTGDAAQGSGAGQDLRLRVGVHTGEVAFGAGFEARDTLTGDAVNVAARMEQSAPPGGLRISADTWALVRGRFVADAQPPLQLRGMDAPVRSWLVRAAGAAGAERGVEGLQVPMVGRDAELARLRQCLAGPVEGGGLRAVTLIGDAGLGKSRLLREALGAPADGRTLLQARAQPRDGLRAWGLVSQLVAGACGIADSDSAVAARDKLLAGLAPFFLADAEAQSQLIGQLIGLDFGDVPELRDLDARARRDRALAALLAWLDGLGRQRPGTVLVIEDLHWADEASLDALAHVMARGRSLPLALLMSARPALLELRPAWGEGPAGAEAGRITLVPLPAADGAVLAAALLPGLQPVPPALQALLTERAEGNPYYMEELVRRLRDEGVVVRDGGQWRFDALRLHGLRLPTTLVGLLQARLDALPPAERAGAQRASIVGHVFWDSALAAIDPAAVDAIEPLQRRHWVWPHGPSAFEGSAEHRFDHHLLHEVTYGTVLKDDRRRGHAAVARWLAERTQGRGPAFLAVTGDHAERAGDHALAADCFERAAVEARKRFANRMAIDCYQRALRMMDPGNPGRRLQVLDRLCDLADLMGNRELQARILDEADSILACHPDPYQQAHVTTSRALLADRLGDTDQAFALATGALVQADAGGNDDAAALAHGELCWLHGLRGEREAARRHLAEGQVRAARVRERHPIREVQLLMMAAVVAMRDEQALEAGALLAEALARAQASRDARRLALSAVELLTEQARSLGEWSRAQAWADRGVDAARTLGDGMREAGLLAQSALVALAQGDAERALALADRALPLARAAGSVVNEARLSAIAGLAHRQRGDPQAARAAFEQALALYFARDPGGADAAAMRALAAREALALGDVDGARVAAAQAQAALEGAAPIGVREFDWEGRWACVEVLAALGDARAAAGLAPLQDAVRQVSLARAGTPDAALDLQRRIPVFGQILAAPGTPAPRPAAS